MKRRPALNVFILTGGSESGGGGEWGARAYRGRQKWKDEKERKREKSISGLCIPSLLKKQSASETRDTAMFCSHSFFLKRVGGVQCRCTNILTWRDEYVTQVVYSTSRSMIKGSHGRIKMAAGCNDYSNTV